jgi:CHRD domain
MVEASNATSDPEPPAVTNSPESSPATWKETNVRKFVTVLAAGAVCALAGSALSSASTHTTVWTAALSSGQEIPPQVIKDAAAHGLFKATLSGTTLKWKLTFAKLTGPATAAHIHMAAKGKPGNVVVPLCLSCKSGMTGTATVNSALLTAFKKHLLYVNVHTASNPAGEIRGQLAVG